MSSWMTGTLPYAAALSDLEAPRARSEFPSKVVRPARGVTLVIDFEGTQLPGLSQQLERLRRFKTVGILVPILNLGATDSWTAVIELYELPKPPWVPRSASERQWRYAPTYQALRAVAAGTRTVVRLPVTGPRSGGGLLVRCLDPIAETGIDPIERRSARMAWGEFRTRYDSPQEGGG